MQADRHVSVAAGIPVSDIIAVTALRLIGIDKGKIRLLRRSRKVEISGYQGCIHRKLPGIIAIGIAEKALGREFVNLREPDLRTGRLRQDSIAVLYHHHRAELGIETPGHEFRAAHKFLCPGRVNVRIVEKSCPEHIHQEPAG